MKRAHDLSYQVYFISVQNDLKDAIALAWGRSLFYQLDLRQNVTASGYVQSSSSGSERLDFESDGSEDDSVYIYNARDWSTSELKLYVLIDSFLEGINTIIILIAIFPQFSGKRLLVQLTERILTWLQV